MIGPYLHIAESTDSCSQVSCLLVTPLGIFLIAQENNVGIPVWICKIYSSQYHSNKLAFFTIHLAHPIFCVVHRYESHKEPKEE